MGAISRAVNGVPTPTLTLQLSCNELANGEDDVLSRKLWSNYYFALGLVKG